MHYLTREYAELRHPSERYSLQFKSRWQLYPYLSRAQNQGTYRLRHTSPFKKQPQQPPGVHWKMQLVNEINPGLKTYASYRGAHPEVWIGSHSCWAHIWRHANICDCRMSFLVSGLQNVLAQYTQWEKNLDCDRWWAAGVGFSCLFSSTELAIRPGVLVSQFFWTLVFDFYCSYAMLGTSLKKSLNPSTLLFQVI